MRLRGFYIFGAVLALGTIILSPLLHAQTQVQEGDFGLQVTPSPLVTTVKPGQTTELELKIRNSGSQAEELKIEPRSFRLEGEEVKLDDTTPPDIDEWISFKDPTFTIQPGQWFTQKIKLDMPEDTGFSYPFVLLISRKNAPQPVEGGRLIKGAVAVFTLVNVDRPGAIRKLEVGEFEATKRVYEYLPATFNIRLKNSGNTIVQPYGNVYIQRGKGSQSPLATLQVNETKGYILAGSTRTLATQWQGGFPSYTISKDAAGSETKNLAWDWAKVSEFRIGRYTAKLVAVYNDGQRDIPLEAEVSFWVIPWKAIILLIFAIAGLWYFQRRRNKRRTEKAVKKALAAAKKEEAAKKHE